MRLFYCEDEQGNEYLFLGKTDVQSAFCLLCLNKASWRWLVMKARHPVTSRWQYFVDKCLPFGASISCALFQRFSDTLKYLIQFRTAMDTINNCLDDFLFIAATILLCNFLIREFLDMCHELGVPIADNKTEWASIRIVFLGILLDGQFMIMIIPEEKRLRAIAQLSSFLNCKKATVKDLQSLCRFLNFLNKAVVPG